MLSNQLKEAKEETQETPVNKIDRSELLYFYLNIYCIQISVPNRTTMQSWGKIELHPSNHDG